MIRHVFQVGVVLIVMYVDMEQQSISGIHRNLKTCPISKSDFDLLDYKLDRLSTSSDWL